MDIKETDLFKPIEGLLIDKGYEVYGEVKDCDIIAKKEEDIIAIELKKNITLKLLTQAILRKEISETVYIAVPKPKKYMKRPYNQLIKLIKQLELGLILVDFKSYKTEVYVEFHPMPYKLSQKRKTKYAVLNEVDNRTYNMNLGGGTRVKEMTAYRENCIHVACVMEGQGIMTPKAIRGYGTGEKTTRILSQNHYSWFERIEKGVYRLGPLGYEGLAQFSEISDHYRALVKAQSESMGE